jgi:hypothetical protein
MSPFVIFHLPNLFDRPACAINDSATDRKNVSVSFSAHSYIAEYRESVDSVDGVCGKIIHRRYSEAIFRELGPLL